MNKLLQKRSRLAQIQSRVGELRAIETRSETEEAELANILTEGETLIGDIEALQAEEARAARIAEFAGRSANPLPTPAPAPATRSEGSGIDPARLVIPAVARRSGPGQVFADDRMAYAFARQALAALGGSSEIVQRSARWCQENGVQLRATGLQEGTDTAGGYLVAPEFSTDIIRLVAQYGVVRRFSRIVQMGSSEILVPKRTAGVSASPVGELATIGKTAPTYGRVALNARKWGILIPTSNEFSEDTFVDFGNQLAMEIALAFAIAEDASAFKGDGTSTYHKIVGIIPSLLAVSSNVGIEAAAGNTFDEITTTDLLNMKSKLPSYAWQLDRAGIRWFTTMEFVTGAFERLALAAGGVTADQWMNSDVQKFLGIPIEIVETLTTEGGNSEVPLLLGSLRLGTMFGDRRMVSLAMSEHSAFAQDALEWRATERFDFNCHEPGTSTTAGPIVGLQLAGS
jgi:HK97 family phage major capsid protein